MTKTAALNRRTEPLRLPSDLSEWIDKQLLWEWTVEDVESLDWRSPDLLDLLEANPDYRPKLLLCLISYGYANGVWESPEIARLYESEPMIQKLDPAGPPSPQSLSRFRRDNRGLVKWSLAHLLKRTVKAHLNLSDPLFPPGLKRYVVDAAVARIDLARQMERGA